MFTIEKKKVTRSGISSMGWQLGYGYVSQMLSVRTEVWCVCENGKVIAECRGEKKAYKILIALINNEVK